MKKKLIELPKELFKEIEKMAKEGIKISVNKQIEILLQEAITVAKQLPIMYECKKCAIAMFSYMVL